VQSYVEPFELWRGLHIFPSTTNSQISKRESAAIEAALAFNCPTIALPSVNHSLKSLCLVLQKSKVEMTIQEQLLGISILI
jgi:hypothetical protein